MAFGAVTLCKFRSSYPRGGWWAPRFVIVLMSMLRFLAGADVGIVRVKIRACRVVVRLRLSVGPRRPETSLFSSPPSPAASSRPAGITPPASEVVTSTASATAMRSASVRVSATVGVVTAPVVEGPAAPSPAPPSAPSCESDAWRKTAVVTSKASSTPLDGPDDRGTVLGNPLQAADA